MKIAGVVDLHVIYLSRPLLGIKVKRANYPILYRLIVNLPQQLLSYLGAYKLQLQIEKTNKQKNT